MAEPTNLADRIHARRPAPAEDDPDAADDRGAFGLLRGMTGRAVMLDLRLRDGGRVAFPYALLERVSYDPSDGIALRFLGAAVVVRGRNLARPGAAGVSLLDGLHRHRVAWLAESDELHAALRPADAVVVTGLELHEPR